MERQQLLESSERGVVFSGEKRIPRESAPQLPLRDAPHHTHTHTRANSHHDRYEARSFMNVISEMFGRKHRNTPSFICDVILTSLLVFSLILLLDCSCGLVVVQATPVISEKQLSTFHCEYYYTQL